MKPVPGYFTSAMSGFPISTTYVASYVPLFRHSTATPARRPSSQGEGELAFIFLITCPRWALTVITLIPSSHPICLSASLRQPVS